MLNLTVMKNEYIGSNTFMNTKENQFSFFGVAKSAGKGLDFSKKTTTHSIGKERLNGNSSSKKNQLESRFREDSIYNFHLEKKLADSTKKYLSTKFDTAYSRDYFNYLIKKEQDSLILEDNFSKQRHIDSCNRMIIVDFILQVQSASQISLATFHLSVLFIDKYLNKYFVTREEFLNIAHASLMVASKFEDLRSRSIEASNIIKMAGDIISEKELLRLEKELLDDNVFRMGYVQIERFISKLKTVMQSSKNKELLDMMGIVTAYYYQLSSNRMSHVVHCLLEVLKSLDSPFCEKNSDFSDAQDYLCLEMLSRVECADIMSKLQKTFLLIKMNSFEGLVQKFGDKLGIINNLLQLQIYHQGDSSIF